MEGATGFIEVYKTHRKISHSDIAPIIELTYHLGVTASMGFKTIAIWYIKAKTEDSLIYRSAMNEINSKRILNYY